MKRAAFVLVLLTALPVQAATYPMAGVWFGTGQPDDKSEMYIDRFNADGSFNNHHRYCRQGKVYWEARETGRWSVKGDVLTINIATVSGKPDPRTDLYRLTSVDAKTQNYIALVNNFPYHARRMDPKFEMPSCDLSS